MMLPEGVAGDGVGSGAGAARPGGEREARRILQEGDTATDDC